jgi:hypothetical protein
MVSSVCRLLPNADAGHCVHLIRQSVRASGGSRILRVLLEETEERMKEAAQAIDDGTPTVTLRSEARIRHEGLARSLPQGL